MSLLLLFNQSLSDSGAEGQDVLDLMELLNAELQLQPGEPDVTKALVALNAAQDFFEALASQHTDMLGGQVGEFETTADTESITFPLGLMRLDRLFLMTSDDKVEREIEPIKRAGGAKIRTTWPYNITSTSGAGKPQTYWTNGRTIYFNPIPDQAYNLRWIGFAAQDNLDAEAEFMYPDICMLPMAAFATRLIKMGLDDNVTDVMQLASDTFVPVLDSMRKYHRDGAVALNYVYTHNT